MRELATHTRRPAPVSGPRLAVAVLAVLVAAPFASAVGYGDVEVTVKSEPPGTASHGYAEFEFLVVNRSAQAAHEVRITYPKSSYSHGGDHIRALSRTVTVEAGKSVRAVLAYPERIELGGNGAGVAIDGRDQEDAVPVGRGTGSRAYSYGGYTRSYSGSPREPVLVLYSKSVDTRFPDWTLQTRAALTAEGRSYTAEVVRAAQTPDQWSTNWLGYSRYDGVVVTADDLRTMPAEVRTALGQYVECGGSLLVFGPNPSLPGPWKLAPSPEYPVAVATPGFGYCATTDLLDIALAPAPVLVPAFESWTATAAPWQRARTPNEANRLFPVVDDVGVPVRGLLFLMSVFAVVIGPVNLFVLARLKRKLWLFWTVPVISFVTCLIVIGYMAVTEGWQGRSRIEGLTVLDENSRRASTLGWTGFYTPLLPGGGLHFSAETEVNYQNGEDGSVYRRRGSSGSALTIDWTRDQHLTSGWLTPRVPAHFVLRRGELRRERMTIGRGADGAPEAVNGLGADLSAFWYLDEGGVLYHADAIPAGGRAALSVVRNSRSATPLTLRGVYGGEWSSFPVKMTAAAPALLAPRTYLGVLEGAPFLEDPMAGASVHKARSVVYGILKEGGDGG